MRSVASDPAEAHVRFIYAALGFGVIGGFTLAVLLPVQMALDRLSLSWLVHVQVHGHLQVIGFAGLFVVGVASKLGPRFGIGHLAYPVLVDVAFWALVSGVLLRALGQPLADQPPFAAIMAAGAALELAGAACFAASMLATLRPALAAWAPHALFVASGAVWFVVQSALGLWWLGEAAADGQVLLRSDRNVVLLTLQFFGFLLGVFAGVGMRSFPTFFGMPVPSQRFGLAAFAALQSGLLVWVATDYPASALADASGLGPLLVGAGVLLLVSAFGWWRRETRLAAASQPIAWGLRGTLLSLTLTGLMLVGFGLDALLDAQPLPFDRSDAVRHVFALGVVTLGIVSMAQLILPEFATERMVRRPGRWRGAAFAAALLLAVVLRGLLPLAGIDPVPEAWAMALAGTIALVTVAVFAALFVRAHTAHRGYQRRLATRRSNPLPMLE